LDGTIALSNLLLNLSSLVSDDYTRRIDRIRSAPDPEEDSLLETRRLPLPDEPFLRADGDEN
jgi:hypothetical protein